jgi:hypothetical protein
VSVDGGRAVCFKAVFVTMILYDMFVDYVQRGIGGFSA